MTIPDSVNHGFIKTFNLRVNNIVGDLVVPHRVVVVLPSISVDDGNLFQNLIDEILNLAIKSNANHLAHGILSHCCPISLPQLVRHQVHPIRKFHRNKSGLARPRLCRGVWAFLKNAAGFFKEGGPAGRDESPRGLDSPRIRRTSRTAGGSFPGPSQAHRRPIPRTSRKAWRVPCPSGHRISGAFPWR